MKFHSLELELKLRLRLKLDKTSLTGGARDF